jgi:CheY-like chemotaxis protein
MFHADRSRLRAAHTYELSLDQHSSGAELRRADAPEYVAALERGEEVAIEDVASDSRLTGLLQSYLIPLGISSMLEVPIQARGEVVALLRHEHVGMPRSWSADERSFARSAAQFAALACESDALRRSESETSRRAMRLAAVCEIAQLGLAGVDRAALEKRAVEGIVRALRYPLCLLARPEHDRELRVCAGSGFGADTIGSARIETGPRSMGAYLRSAGGTVISTDLATESRFKAPDLLREHGAASGVTVPIGEGARGGVLGVYATDKRTVDPDDIQFLEDVANVVALACRPSAGEPAPEATSPEPRRASPAPQAPPEPPAKERSAPPPSADAEDSPPVEESPEQPDATVDGSVTIGPLAEEGRDGEKSRGRVLLAELTFEVQQVIERTLEERRFQVVTVRDGQVALEEALIAYRMGQPFRVILMDLQLPGLDGLSAARRLREQGYSGPMIAITDGSSAQRSQSLAAGFNDCTVKPIQSRELIGCVKKQLIKQLAPDR